MRSQRAISQPPDRVNVASTAAPSSVPVTVALPGPPKIIVHAWLGSSAAKSFAVAPAGVAVTVVTVGSAAVARVGPDGDDEVRGGGGRGRAVAGLLHVIAAAGGQGEDEEGDEQEALHGS